MEFENTIKTWRRKTRTSQRDLAERIGISLHDEAMIESGCFVSLNEEQLLRLATLVNVDQNMFILMYKSEFSRELKSLSSEEKPGTDPKEETSDIDAYLIALPLEIKESLINMLVFLQKNNVVSA